MRVFDEVAEERRSITVSVQRTCISVDTFTHTVLEKIQAQTDGQ